MRVFLDVGCVDVTAASQGEQDVFQKAGAVDAVAKSEGRGPQVDHQGRRRPMVFKVPTLKNIAKTSPYFHDGSAATLRRRHCARWANTSWDHAFGEDEANAIGAWMKALMTGRGRSSLRRRPRLADQHPPHSPPDVIRAPPQQSAA